MGGSKVSGANAPYRLRAHKGIERNLFIDLLKVVDGANIIDVTKYRYVGFGAASLEDFKAFHLELGIIDMHSIEQDKFAISRQKFNNPFHFLKTFENTSTAYLTNDFELGVHQILWLDYVSNDLSQQLLDIEFATAKMTNLDILKLTFNVQTTNFIKAHKIYNITKPTELCLDHDFRSILKFLKDHATYQFYIPGKIKGKDISNFSSLVRAMALRAINRGLEKNENKDLVFNHLAAFDYADGQKMTTVAGLIAERKDYNKILRQCKLKLWPFYKKFKPKKELFEATNIAVPDMTVSERIAIDKKLPTVNIKDMAKDLPFHYGKEQDHLRLIEGYQTYYKYLPYYSKVTY